VLAAELLVVAAFEDGLYGQAFPAFGGERRGAAVQAFVRLDTHPIRLRYRVYNPHWVIVLDPSLLDVTDVGLGLQSDGIVLINSEKPASSLSWAGEATVICIPATRIATEALGQPLVNTAMLGALSAVTGAVSLEAIQRAFGRRLPLKVSENNGRAARSAYEWVLTSGAKLERVAGSHTPPVTEPWDSRFGLGAPGRPLHFATVVGPRTALAYHTGSWRYARPVFDSEKCNGCGICRTYCPDSCILVKDKKHCADYLYCKGCGICARECPAGAILMVAEEG
jgi:pyruvate ferredoxin oxidoreductase gamma subunit